MPQLNHLYVLACNNAPRLITRWFGSLENITSIHNAYACAIITETKIRPCVVFSVTEQSKSRGGRAVSILEKVLVTSGLDDDTVGAEVMRRFAPRSKPESWSGLVVFAVDFSSRDSSSDGDCN
jgi:hypothetical protein